MIGGGGGLSGPDSHVETISRLAQRRVDTFGPCSYYRRSDPFKLGIWNWFVPTANCYRFTTPAPERHLSVEKSRSIYVRLFPEPGRLYKEQPPLARFVLRVSWAGPPRRSLVSPVLEQLLRSSDDFVWQVDVMSHGRFAIDVEFLDLRVVTNNASILSFSTYQSGDPVDRETYQRLVGRLFVPYKT